MLRRATKKLLGNAAAAFDRAATLAAYAQAATSKKKSRAESLGHAERLESLAGLATEYPPDLPDFFRAPRSIAPTERRVRAIGRRGRVVDIAWPSDHVPLSADVRDRWERARQNQQVATRLYLHAAPRPVAICIHGYMAGQYAVEERMWPVEWLARIGLDVALFVLPFHGLRASPERRGPPAFPGADPRVSNEGFRQAMGDLRDLVEWLLGRGHASVGVMGMSLGGYTTALAATVEPRLSFAVPIIPLASLADFARDQGRLGRTPAETALEHKALDAVHRIVSPLHRAALIEPRRILVVGAAADRITPVEHARRLAHHFGAPLVTWHGGHLLQFGRGDGFRRIGRLLGELGVLRSR